MLVTVRGVQKKDIDQIHAIELSSHRAPWSRDILGDCLMVGYDCRLVEIPPHQKIVGYVICRYPSNVCHILNLCVDFMYHRQGYGELLLRSVLDSLSRTAIEAAILEVRPSNLAALSLYKKFGFVEDIVKEKYYKDGDEEEDAILLKKNL